MNGHNHDDLDDLKALITHNLDVIDFLDILDIALPELVDILEEQIEEKYNELYKACL